MRLACAIVGAAAMVAGCVPTAPETPNEESSSMPFVPMPDPASMQQVILPAREFVVLNQLQDVN